MHNEPWIITVSKRKQEFATPNPPKRQRRSAINQASETRTTSQRTLTQAQWVTPTSLDVRLDDQILKDTRPRTLPTKLKPKKSLKKRDSTLTQMDFFANGTRDFSPINDSLLPELTNNQGNMAITQVDGNYSSPRKPRKRKMSFGVLDESNQDNAIHSGSQEYKPGERKRRNRHSDKDSSSVSRRVSTRLSAKKQVLSDPAENLAYFSEALVTSTRERPAAGGSVHNQPSIEIKDSIDDEEDLLTNLSSVATMLVSVRTPTKNKTVILSSQSPESLPPSMQTATRFRDSDSMNWRPLKERSVNESPSKSLVQRALLCKSASPAKKIVSLRLPKRSAVQTASRVEDSQKNLWSIPSSSPQQVRKDLASSNVDYQHPPIGQSSICAEIPASSHPEPLHSSSAAHEDQDHLPNLADIFGRRNSLSRRLSVRSELAASISTLAEGNNVETREFSTNPQYKTRLCSPKSSDLVFAFVDDPAQKGRVDDGFQIIEDSEDDGFGSPIKSGDGPMTPKRTRLPSSVGSVERHQKMSGTKNSQFEIVEYGTSAGAVEEGKGQDALEEVIKTPLPLPKLVHPTAQKEVEEARSPRRGPKDFVLPQVPSARRAETQITTTQIPLNDADQIPSSSPSLPPAKTVTQRSVRPAMMPNPSQISTQDATQGLMGLSSFPRHTQSTQHSEFNRQSLTDKVTIKDSSSFQVSLSQYPRHQETQSQARVDLGLDEVFNSEEEGDIDLDPPSTPPAHESQILSDVQIERTPPSGRVSKRGRARDEDEVQIGTPAEDSQALADGDENAPVQSSQISISPVSSPYLAPLKKKWPPLPGFDNDTQSNFTQNGHVTAAYIHRQREAGVIPDWYIPGPYQVPGYTRRK